MIRLIPFLVLILCMVMVTGSAWGVTYNLGPDPDDDYETFTALEAAVVLAGDDIVDGGFNSFSETWAPATAGTSGHQIALQYATIQNYTGLNNIGYITIDTIDFDGGTGRAIDFSGVCDGFVITDPSITDTDYDTPIWIDAGDGGLISGGTISQGNQYMLVFIGSGGTYVTNTTVEDITFTGTVGKSFGDGMYLSNGDGNTYQDLTITDWNLANQTDEIFRCINNTDDTFQRISISGTPHIIFNLALGTGYNIANNTIDGAFGFISSTATDFTVTSNVVRDLTHHVIQSSTGAGTITDNRFSNTSVAASKSGLLLTDTDLTSSGNVFDAYHIGISLSGAYTATSDGDEIKNCAEDAFSTNGTGTFTVWRGKASNNGTSGVGTAGDAFTSHENSVLNTRFTSAIENLRDSHGLVGGSTGSIYHHVAINNDQATDSDRAELYLTTSGVFTVKNSIWMNTNSYPIIRYDGAAAHVMDYNAYISNLAAPFDDDGSMLTFSQWVALVGNETNSWYIYEVGDGTYQCYKGDDPGTLDRTLTYCPVTSDGKLANRSDNPLIGGGVTIAGVNDAEQTDLAGHKMYGTPDIGAYEVVPRTRKTFNLGGPCMGIGN